MSSYHQTEHDLIALPSTSQQDKSAMIGKQLTSYFKTTWVPSWNWCSSANITSHILAMDTNAAINYLHYLKYHLHGSSSLPRQETDTTNASLRQHDNLRMIRAHGKVPVHVERMMQWSMLGLQLTVISRQWWALWCCADLSSGLNWREEESGGGQTAHWLNFKLPTTSRLNSVYDCVSPTPGAESCSGQQDALCSRNAIINSDRETKCPTGSTLRSTLLV